MRLHRLCRIHVETLHEPARLGGSERQYGELGDVRWPDDTTDGERGANLIATVFGFIPEERIDWSSAREAFRIAKTRCHGPRPQPRNLLFQEMFRIRDTALESNAAEKR